MNSTLNKIRVLWADDNFELLALYKIVFTEQPDFQNVGYISSPDDLEKAIGERSPDVVVLDLSMHDHPLDTMKRCLLKFPGIRFLIFSAHDDPFMVENAMKAGAAGYKVKDGDLEDLARCVRRIAKGLRVIPQGRSFDV